MKNFQKIIDDLKLMPHPEGGYYSEVYRSDEYYRPELLPSRYSGKRNFSTLIYFLLSGEDISLFHRLKSDEIWHFYSGSNIILHCLNTDGYNQIFLGNDSSNNISFQYVIKHGTWFAAEVADNNSYALVGCSVSPGFDFDDFELAERKQLIAEFPDYKNLITKFTK